MMRSHVENDLRYQIELIQSVIGRLNEIQAISYGIVLHKLKNCLIDQDYDRADQLIQEFTNK